MNFLKKLFQSPKSTVATTVVNTYEDFWNWFRQQEKDFFNIIKNRDQRIEEDFFNKLSPKLKELRDGYFFLAGMYDNNTAELIITADGRVKNIIFVEELIAAAPAIAGWKFTALKQPTDMKGFNINMSGYNFTTDNMWFYANELPGYPDEVDVVVVHSDLDENNKEAIGNGIFIYLDNYLGELDFATNIDNISVVSRKDAAGELIPIEKLKEYLVWRQKEFVEKYEGVRRDTENDSYASFEAELENGRPLIAIANTDLLNWDSTPSHPWILHIEIGYKGGQNGMPDDSTYQLLNEIEDQVTEKLKDAEGYLNIGRQTADDTRDVFFACREFRLPSKIMDAIRQRYGNRVAIGYDIYRDKYWRTFDRFRS